MNLQGTDVRNSSQLSLADQGLSLSGATRETLVAVDLNREDIREVASMVDLAASYKSVAPSSNGTNGALMYTLGESMFIDIHNDAYRRFGQDVCRKLLLFFKATNRSRLVTLEDDVSHAECIGGDL